MIRKSPSTRANAHPVATVLFVLFMCLVVTFPVIVSAAPNDGVEGLSEEQQALAARYLDFLSDMDGKFFDRARQLNGGVLKEESQEFNYDFADYYSRVGRGSVIEKIGRVTGKILKTLSDIQSPIVFSRYYAIDVHAESPLAGHIHAA